MTRKTKILLLSLVFTTVLTMTAITVTMNITETGGDGNVEVGHSPLFIDQISSASSTPSGNASVDVATTARGFDRVTVELDADIAEGDYVTIRPEMKNTADRALYVRLSTNTSANVILTDVQPSGSNIDNLTQVSPINNQPAIYEFRLVEGASPGTAGVDLNYNVTDDAAGTRGQFDIGLRLDPLPADA
jgi:hypothetical protein